MEHHAFSIWSSYDVDLSPEDMVLAIERRGMHLSELSDEHAAMLLAREGDPMEIGRAFGAFAASHGVSFPQGHLFLRARLCSGETDSVAILTRWLLLFAGIGIRNAVLHCDARSFPDDAAEEEIIAANAGKLRLLTPTAEKHGICICLENLRGRVFHSAEGLLRVIEAVGSPALGICLDTGHLNLVHPGEQAAFIEKAGSRLHALHIADNQGETDQHMMPFGRGTVDFFSVMKALKKIGYRDLFNYEIPGERNLPPVLRGAKAKYLEAVTDTLFASVKDLS